MCTLFGSCCIVHLLFLPSCLVSFVIPLTLFLNPTYPLSQMLSPHSTTLSHTSLTHPTPTSLPLQMAQYGLTLTTSGLLNGTPNAQAASTGTILGDVRADNGQIAEHTYTFIVTSGPSQRSNIPDTTAKSGVAYSNDLAQYWRNNPPGQTTYQFVTGKGLPSNSGLVLDPNTGMAVIECVMRVCGPRRANWS